MIKFFSHGGIGDPHSGGTGAPRQWTPSPVLVARNYSASNILSLRGADSQSHRDEDTSLKVKPKLLSFFAQ